MICTCNTCRRNFFPMEGEPPVCPVCQQPVDARVGWSELHYLVQLLADGEIREALARYRNTEPEKAPALREVTDQICRILFELPRDFADRYFIEINQLLFYINDYNQGRYYENLHRRGTPKIETMGKKMMLTLMAFEHRMYVGAPGAGEWMLKLAKLKPEDKQKENPAGSAKEEVSPDENGHTETPDDKETDFEKLLREILRQTV